MTIQTIPQFDLDAGVDCLAFANTVDRRGMPKEIDSLRSYSDLVAFTEQTGNLPVGMANDLRLMAERNPDQAEAVFRRAVTFREAVYRAFSAIAAGNTPDEADLDLFNSELHEAMVPTRLVPVPGGFDWTWPETPLMLDRALWPIVRSAADLLISGELDRIRECAAHDCTWLFFDESRNRSRRWCSMQTCGNRAKVDRFRKNRRSTDDLLLQ
jgi:predicted RNA-binding Zn ribbon-like protein